MKTLTLITLLILILQLNVKSQDFKIDNRPQYLKEDSKNNLQSNEITNIDLLQALDLMDIKLHKFNIGDFEEKYNLYFLLEEVLDGENVKTDTIYKIDNIYAFYENDIRYFNYLNQIKIFTKQEQEKLKLKIIAYDVTWQRNIKYKTTEKNQNYYIKYYSNVTWKDNVVIPLFIFASSWKDKDYGFQRFCGPVQLDDENDETKALLKMSPHYFKISYVAAKTTN